MEGLVKLASLVGKNAQKVFDYLKENYPEDCIQWAKKVDWTLKSDVPLKDIKMARRPGGAREQDKVKGIAQAVKEGKPMEPVVLVRLSDGSIKIADGYHRTLGFKHAEKESIKAWIADVEEAEGPWDKEMHEKKLNVGKKASYSEWGLVGLAKEASLLGLLGLSTAIHVAPNLTMKAVKNTNTGQKALAGMFSAGVEMGRNGRKMHPNVKNVMEYGLGPESVVEYNLGRTLGDRISHMEPEKQERFISKARGMTDAFLRQVPEQAEQIDKVPILGSVKHYFDGKGENKVKDFFVNTSVPHDQPLTWKNRAGDLAMLGGAGALDPHLLIQPALSGVRKQVAKSPLGKKVFEGAFNKGNDGVTISKPKELAVDLLVSPSVLDPYRIGKSMKENLPEHINQEVKSQLDIGALHSKMMQGK